MAMRRYRLRTAKHGLSRSAEYLAHKNMLDRCNSPNDIGWKNYGGRGIRVCERWLGDGGFEAFYADLGPKPSPRHSLDRIDPDGHYEPRNVRWATPKEQNRNKRDIRLISFRGETKPLAAWAEDIGYTRHALWARLFVHGWSVEKAFTTPVQTHRYGITFNGTTLTMAAWSRKLGLPRETIRSRLRKGWPVGKALTTPYLGRRPGSGPE